MLVLGTACSHKGGDWQVEPLYKNNVNQKIDSIYVATIGGDKGVYLHNELSKRIKTNSNPKYRLESKFTITEKNLAIGNDSSVTRKQVNVKVNFKLVDITGSGKVIKTFTTFGFANYSTSSTAYLSEVSKEHATRRSLSIASNSAILRISLMFKNGIIK